MDCNYATIAVFLLLNFWSYKIQKSAKLHVIMPKKPKQKNPTNKQTTKKPYLSPPNAL